MQETGNLNNLVECHWYNSLLESTVSWFLIESNQSKQAYYFLPNTENEYRTKFENNSLRSISKYHRVIRQQASLYLDSLIATTSWVFGTRIFTITYTPISKTSSTQITCWTHIFFHNIPCLLPKNGLVTCVPSERVTGKFNNPDKHPDTILNQHVWYNMMILYEGRFPHPWCSPYDMFVPWAALNGWHPGTYLWDRGAEQKRLQIAAEAARYGA